jgi:hypothetical protein
MPPSTIKKFNSLTSITSDLTAFQVYMVLIHTRHIKSALHAKFGLHFILSAILTLWAIAIIRNEDIVNRVKFSNILCPPYSPATIKDCITFFNRKKIFDQNKSTKECFVLTPFGVEVVNTTVSLLSEMATQRLTRLNIDPDEDTD